MREEVTLDAGDLDRDIAIVSRSHLAEHIAGGLSLKEQMPCPSWGISGGFDRRAQVILHNLQRPDTLTDTPMRFRG